MKTLKNKVILLTGAGGGIGFETAQVLASKEAFIIIVDIDKDKGSKAVQQINNHYPNSAVYYEVDLSDASQVKKLCDDVYREYGCPDVVFNNATIVPLGSIGDVDIVTWDKSYFVNLRAPILLANYFLPYMRKRNSGCLIFVSSSGAAPFMGAYETFKTAQVEVSNTLALELENTNVYSYKIGPGLVKTDTAEKSIIRIASNTGMSIDEFYDMNKAHILSATEASTGFALSILNAEKYHGQEISSIQVLNDFHYYTQTDVVNEESLIFDTELIDRIMTTFQEQYDGWNNMNIFERQWVLRDFKKHVGCSADKAKSELLEMQKQFDNTKNIAKYYQTF